MSVLNENTIIGASAAGGDYEIEQSLRFNDGRGSYLSRTPSSAGNRKTWTYSFWVKLADLFGGDGSTKFLFSVGTWGATEIIQLGTDANSIFFEGYTSAGATKFAYKTTALYRDPSAWYHIVASVDTTQSTAADRVKLYVNGSRVTGFSTETTSALNYDTGMNAEIVHTIGNRNNTTLYMDGYLAEVNLIDGQALTPDSFGETGDYGEWKPIEYAGTYGTNGFYLPFEQDYTVEGFSTVTYEGTRQNQYIGGTGFKPDLVWMKTRSATGNSVIIDSVRGRDNALQTSTTSYENQYGTADDKITAFNNDGFTLGVDAAGYGLNNDGVDTVAWNWDMGGTTASNTSGSITSSVRANTTYGQSIVGYTGNGTAGATVGHGLASAPTMVIVKSRTVAGKHWATYHVDLGNTVRIDLESSGAKITGTGAWNSTTPTSSLVTLGSQSDVNTSSATHIMYAFHDVANYSKFGSYSGNGSSTGPVITLGFSPAFVMIKRTDSATSWFIHDNVRDPSNPNTAILKPNSNSAEFNGTAVSVDFLSTGFQLKNTDASFNASGGTYIYAAFADTREYAYWYDQSGNNNDWTSEGGLTESDVMLDSPTNNFATMSEIASTTAAGYTSTTYSEGNLEIKSTSGVNAARSPFRMQGKSYFEACIVNLAYQVVGFGSMGWDGQQNIGTGFAGLNVYPNAGAEYLAYNVGGSKVDVGPNAFSSAALTVFGFAYDETSGKAWVSINGTWYGSGNPATGANPAVTFNANLRNNIFPSGAGHPNGSPSGSPLVFNFGADSSFAGNKTPQGNQDANSVGDFFYPVPSGFLALCTSNLPDVDVIPSENFNPVLYTGNATARSITGVGFAPDFTWIKDRSSTYSHNLYDTVRGANNILFSDTAAGQDTATSNRLTAFDADGFTLGNGVAVNANGNAHVAWNWKAGGAASSNTNGTITSSVSANPSAGFSIVADEANGNVTSRGHGLASAPEMIIRKNRDSARNWAVWHKDLTANYALEGLNTTGAQVSGGNPSKYFRDINSTTFSVGDDVSVNANGDSYISYCFHSVDGYSKVGSYTGNGSADGTFVHCGFRPAFVLRKLTTSAGSWRVQDDARNSYNVANLTLLPNSGQAESTSGNEFDMLSNGFKVRATSLDTNASGSTYIFLAFAENPFKHTNAR